MFPDLAPLILWVINIATTLLAGWAVLDCTRRRPDAFPAIGRSSKNLWLALTGGALLVSLAGFRMTSLLGIAAIVIVAVYLLDIRPKIAEITGGR